MPFQKSNKLLAKANQWMNEGLPFVVYRFPNDSLLRGVFQENEGVNKFTGFSNRGFVFAPFHPKEDKVLITGEYLEEPFLKASFEIHTEEVLLTEKGKDSHLQLVRKAIEEINRERLQKVVLSRHIKVRTEKAPNEILSALLSKYPSAFCYWWFHPKVGMWLGATPEQLLKLESGKFLTTSLAGTLTVNGNDKPNWTKKEREEQQMVTDYIVSALQTVTKDLEVSSPVNHKAGKLWHLKSQISGELPSRKSLSKVLENLHPTPAVCGLPKADSFDFILRNEGYDREYYTGYLGPINLNKKDSVNLFVNLRCLKYDSGQAHVYVGGGITGASNPEREWRETQFKSRTILEAL